jgi:hypothetical protein
MPAMFQNVYPEFPAVLIREDIAAEYGNEVRTASQYIELLRWLKTKNNNPDYIPGATFPYLPESSGKIMAYDFYMPEWGYWTPRFSWHYFASEIVSNDTRPSYSMPEASRAIEEFTGLWRDGLLLMKNIFYRENPELSEFPTILFYFYDFFEPNYYHAEKSGTLKFDASGYRIYAMYGGVLPVIEYPDGDYWYRDGTVAAAGINTDASEWLRFLEWLGERENYTRLFYGDEGSDYTLSDGKFVPVDEQAAAFFAAVRADFYFLERSVQKPAPLYAPWNLYGEMLALKPAYSVALEKTPMGYFAEAYGDDYRDVFMANYDFGHMLSEVFDYGETAPSEDESHRILGEYTLKQRDRHEILDTYAEVTDKALKAAACPSTGTNLPSESV